MVEKFDQIAYTLDLEECHKLLGEFKVQCGDKVKGLLQEAPIPIRIGPMCTFKEDDMGK